MSTFDLGSDGTAAINTILAEEANRIGQDIHKRTVHTSPWIDLVPQTAFPDGMGYQLTTLVYDRAIPTVTDGELPGLIGPPLARQLRAVIRLTHRARTSLLTTLLTASLGLTSLREKVSFLSLSS